jgi:glycosyltransferase involved in cell wall biosynthesis
VSREPRSGDPAAPAYRGSGERRTRDELGAADRLARRRVAFVLGSLSGGGVQWSALRAAKEMVQRGYAVDLLVSKLRGDLLDEVPEGVDLVEIERASTLRARVRAMIADPAASLMLLRRGMSPRLRSLPSLETYCRTIRPDALLAGSTPLGMIAVWARRLSGIETIVVIFEQSRLASDTVGAGRHRFGVPPALLRHTYLQADAIVSVSNGVGDELSAHARIPRERITTVYNPVTGPHVDAMSACPLEHPWFSEGEPPVIVGVGRVGPAKDFGTLIRAFARVRRDREARLVIVGDDRKEGKDAEYRAELAALPEKLGVTEDVDFVGAVANPFPYMRRASVFVLSSAWEGLGNVVIEALACGCPVVSTDCRSGPREILEDGRYGELVPVGDDEAMATAIQRVLRAPPDPDRQRARAQDFTVARAVDGYLELCFGREPSPLRPAPPA